MNTRIEHLLQPISVEAPCGEDLANSPLFSELETLVRGKPEIEYGAKKEPAEPPDWNKLAQKSAEYLGRSKDLRVAVFYCCALLRIDELAGFCDGLELIRGLIVDHWPRVYPLLDPDDGNDPTQRLNILSPLVRGRGGQFSSGWLTFADYLYVMPLLRAPGVPPVSYERILLARQGSATGDGSAGTSAALKGIGDDRIAACSGLLERARQLVEEIDGFLTTTLGATNSISFEVLTKMLQEIGATLPSARAAAPEAKSAAPTGTQPATGGAMVTGPIHSREDVVRTLEAVCAYYQQAEPGSPVPYLLRRAQKLATMNFVEAVQELALANPEALRPSMGSTIDGPAAKS